MMYKQRTISKSISCEGIGLHSGKPCAISIHPAAEGHGIIFYRQDVPIPVPIPAAADYVSCTMNASTVGINGTRVGTVEHLLAAFYGLGVDNARVEVHAPEIPIMDGSAEPFVELLKDAGIEEQKRGKRVLVIKDTVRVEEQGKYAQLSPSREFRIQCTICFDHPLISFQTRELVFEGETFEKEIAPARTFGFLHEVEELKAKGLAQGGSLENAVVLDQEKVLNPDGLRYEDEFVRHKILDMLGDLMLLGAPVIGRFSAHRSGHALNHKLVKKLLNTPEAFIVLELNGDAEAQLKGFRLPSWGTPEKARAPRDQAFLGFSF